VEADVTSTGPKLLETIRAIRDFFGDLSQLLITAQTLMAARGWVAKDESTCLFGLSYSLYEGRQWMPRFAARWLTNASAPGVMAYVSILLDTYDEEGSLDEPVVAAGYFVLSDGHAQLRHWNTCWYCWRGETADGRTYAVNADDPNWKAGWGWQRHEGFARPLVAMTDQDSLVRLVVEPLLALLTARQGTVAKPREAEIPADASLPGTSP
jgi:hypothetical protein